jgi:hypothetical protein
MFTKLITILAITGIFTCWVVWVPGFGVYCYCTGENPPPVVIEQPLDIDKPLTVDEILLTRE